MPDMFGFEKIAEKRIQEAQERGDFENLAGKGRPIVFEDDSFVSPDLRMAYKILKNSGFLPPELQADREIRETRDLLEGLEDEKERYRQIQKLNLLVTKINIQRPRPVQLEINQTYYRKIVERISG